MLIYNDQLNEAQLRQLDSLAALCQQEDGGTPALYRHLLGQKRMNESNVLYFQQEQLIAFLSAYFFYQDACEISLMVAPNHRQQGLAKQLIQSIMPLLLAKQIARLIFSTAAENNALWLARFGFEYKNSEYRMLRQSYEPILIAQKKLSLRKATEEDIPALCAIDKQCFAKQENMELRFRNLLNDKNYTLLLASHENTVIGKAHIRWQEDGASFSDIAIIPERQGQGYGGELITYCINQALAFGKIKLSLDVETSNRNALNLYTRHGFKIIRTNDFWAIEMQRLQALYG